MCLNCHDGGAGMISGVFDHLILSLFSFTRNWVLTHTGYHVTKYLPMHVAITYITGSEQTQVTCYPCQVS